MTNTEITLFKIHCLCPTLAIMLLEGREQDHYYAIVRMSRAHVKNGHNTGGLYSNAYAYLQSLQKEVNNA